MANILECFVALPFCKKSRNRSAPANVFSLSRAGAKWIGNFFNLSKKLDIIDALLDQQLKKYLQAISTLLQELPAKRKNRHCSHLAQNKCEVVFCLLT